ncbi:uncharacterized protein N7511_001867 [Penicillium nucicola]|uniref:uncharacterized protein n=1 Tax=Penicillium nucicola TaxID=1850975 RepID=UPI002545414B|nr:uncharacterized protein N7511_001867 [Penicillium nucicola]KAJ5769816.1 hypothetical protein N7511_001867 [Penicillium nucicola]
METSNHTSASQRALATIEILSIILFSFTPDQHRPVGEQVSTRGRSPLLSCTLVNRTWYSEAIRALWFEPTAWSRHALARIFDWIPVRRRQMFADNIRKATILTVVRIGMTKHFDGADLHRLQSLTLLIHTPAHIAISIPLLASPSVRHLSIGSKEGYFDQNQKMVMEMWLRLFKSIAELFPNLESLYFQDRVFKDLRVLVKLKQDLGLKSLKQKAWNAPTVDV